MAKSLMWHFLGFCASRILETSHDHVLCQALKMPAGLDGTDLFLRSWESEKIIALSCFDCGSSEHPLLHVTSEILYNHYIQPGVSEVNGDQV